MSTNRNNGLQDKYGNLLDKYVDNAHASYETRQEREEKARNRYGHLLDYAKPNNKIYEDILGIDDMCRRARQEREEAYEQENIRRKERIEREKREEQERIDRNNAFVNSYLEKKEAERKAAEKKRREAEREQSMLNSLQQAINNRDRMVDMANKTNAMLQRDEQRRKEYEEQMEWYRKQEGYLKK